MGSLHLSIDDGVATLTLDNPPQNRLSAELMGGFLDALQTIQGNPLARAVLLRSKGEHFSFGGDINSWPGIEPEAMGALVQRGLALVNAFELLPLPVVSEVRGHCFGGGFEIVLRSDIIVADTSAKFCHTEQTIGVITLLGGVQRVAERAGRTRAMRWALTSERVPAQEMLEAGVITEVVEPVELSGRAEAWAKRLAKGPTMAHAAHKRLLRAWSDGGLEAADRLIPRMTAALFATSDAKAGIQSAVDALSKGIERPSVPFTGT